LAHRLVDRSVEVRTRETLRALGVDFERRTVGMVLGADRPQTHDVTADFRAAGYQTIALTRPNEEADVDLSRAALTPLEWMAAFGLFDVCVSERMHACISAMLGGRPFVAVDFRGGPRSGPARKLAGLLGEAGLADFYLRGDDPVERVLQRCAALRDGDWPADRAASFVARQRERSSWAAGLVRTALGAVVSPA
jgi:polysaccharide pyruvyl transferase WcaK-like protein